MEDMHDNTRRIISISELYPHNGGHVQVHYQTLLKYLMFFGLFTLSDVLRLVYVSMTQSWCGRGRLGY